MNKKLKITLISVGILVAVFVVLMVIYSIVFGMDVIETSEIGKPDAPVKILIASQGSEFKNALVGKITDALKGDDVFIYITDTTKLPEAPMDDYKAVVLIHTVEAWKLEKHVELYLSKTGDLSNLVLVSTSGGGDWKTDKYDVDTITSASKKVELDPVASEVISRVKNIIAASAETKTE